LGPTIFGIDKGGLEEAGEIMKPTIRVVDTNFFNPSITDYRDLLKAVVMDAERNNLILRNVARRRRRVIFALSSRTVSIMRNGCFGPCLLII